MEKCLVKCIAKLAEKTWTSVVKKIVEGRIPAKEDMKVWREEVHSCFKKQKTTCDGVLVLDRWAFPRYSPYARWAMEQ
jgi:hypothetical protein